MLRTSLHLPSANKRITTRVPDARPVPVPRLAVWTQVPQEDERHKQEMRSVMRVQMVKSHASNEALHSCGTRNRSPRGFTIHLHLHLHFDAADGPTKDTPARLSLISIVFIHITTSVPEERLRGRAGAQARPGMMLYNFCNDFTVMTIHFSSRHPARVRRTLESCPHDTRCSSTVCTTCMSLVDVVKRTGQWSSDLPPLRCGRPVVIRAV